LTYSRIKQAVQAAGFEILASNDPGFEDHVVLAERGPGEVYPRSGVWWPVLDNQPRCRYLRVVKQTDSYTSFMEFKVYSPADG